jgi:hypothetical protein
MTPQEIQKRYAMFNGKRQRPADTIRRTENGTTYIMHSKIDARYTTWSRTERDNNRFFSFEKFYNNILNDADRSQIKLTYPNQRTW